MGLRKVDDLLCRSVCRLSTRHRTCHCIFRHERSIGRPPVTVKQALAQDPDIAPYVCGYVTGSGVQMPGVTERYVLEVEENICADGAVISMATMIGKLPGEQLPLA